MMRRLFSKSATALGQGEALPPSVEAAIHGLLVFPRGEDDQGAPRTLLQWSGGAGVVAWHHTPEDTRRRLAESWPDLTTGQLDRACRAVDGLVAAAFRPEATSRKRSEWASWRPSRPSVF